MQDKTLNKIAFIGAGNMARAIAVGLANSGVAGSNIIIANPSLERRQVLAADVGGQHTESNLEAAEFADIVVLSVKPHLIQSVCQELAQGIDVSNKLFISVAAGTTVAQIQQALACQAAVVRVMPNTPAQLGLGMSGLFASAQVSQAQKTAADNLTAAIGEVIWLESEEQINHITAVAGSGPAYFFLFMEAMQAQAQAFGFTEQESRLLVQQTALGAAQMVVNNDVAISTLRENVTSKGGTTFAALEQFRAEGLASTVSNAMNAALTRAEEMARGE